MARMGPIALEWIDPCFRISKYTCLHQEFHLRPLCSNHINVARSRVPGHYKTEIAKRAWLLSLPYSSFSRQSYYLPSAFTWLRPSSTFLICPLAMAGRPRLRLFQQRHLCLPL